ncbi:aminotransferase class I/II-fold pyridoxal phosphate-dependent enzyme, partial [Actinomyces massiliensis]
MRVDFSPPDITDAECQEVVDALRSGWITTGPRTKTLEKQVAQRCGTTRAACLNSATASLELTLRVLGIGPGDEVIVPAYTYTASASPIVHVGATPVIVDAGQADGGYGLDPGALEAAITPRTKAVIPVDIGGRMCDYPALRAVVDSHSHLFTPAGAVQEALGRVALVADGAHSFGARRDGTPSGSAADFT